MSRNPVTVFNDELHQSGRITPSGGYAERNVEWFKKHILPDLLSIPGLSRGVLFDIGCAFGYFTKEYAAHFKKAVGIDFMQNRIDEAVKHNKLSNTEYFQKDIVKSSFDDIKDRADVVVTSAVIQHIHLDNRRRAMENIWRLCSPGAFMVLYDGLVEKTTRKGYDGFMQYPSKEFLTREIDNIWRLLDIKEDVAKSGIAGEIIHRIVLGRVG